MQQPSPSPMSTFDVLITDLTRDAHRAQPKDALQFCADWFNARLQEQRARIRDIFDQNPGVQAIQARRSSRIQSVPDLFRDSPRTSRAPSELRHQTSMPHLSPQMPQLTPQIRRRTSASALGPFDEAPPPNSFSIPGPSVAPSLNGTRRPSAPSPFGTLNVQGNALTPNRPRSSNGNPGFGAIREEEDGSDASSHHDMTIPNPLASRLPAVNNHLGYLGPPPSALGRRVSVSGESISPSSGQERPPPFFPKTPEQLKRLEDAISDAFLFRKLDNKKRKAVLGAMKEVHFSTDQPVIVQGDDGDFFYVVDSGTLDCFKRIGDDDSAPSPSQRADWHPKYGKKVFAYERGGTFGELALMYYAKRAATVVATSPCTLWALDRVTFQTILLNINAATRRSYEGFLASVPLLESLNDAERAKLADVLQPREFNDGEPIVREGEMGKEFFIVEEGEAEVSKMVRNPQGVLTEAVVKRYKRGDYFGELALLHRAPRAATVRAVVGPNQPKLKVAALDADAFIRLLGPLRGLMERSASTMYQTGPHASSM